MTNNDVKSYGWEDDTGCDSASYITPKILSIIKAEKASAVLDLGAGNGAMCGRIRQELKIDVTGVEFDTNGFSIAKKAHPLVKFYNYGVQDDPNLILSDREDLFDVVVSTEVIEHLYSPHLLPQYALPLLSRGGALVLSTPYHGYLKNLVLSLFGAWDKHHTPLWEGGHIKFWSRKTLTVLLESNGFVVENFFGVGRLPFLWKSMILVARKV
jgi:2-polyprenyl-3-methyl-5-hydroxy-6-metoxy-1,4-benzoquinol methylase